MQGETRFKTKVIKDLSTLKNTWFTKIQQTAISGTPDFLVCTQGRFIALELKVDDGKLSPLQEYNLACIKNCGGISMVAMPSTWDVTFQNLIELSEE